MPNRESAKKSLRKNKRRRKENKKIRKGFKDATKKFEDLLEEGSLNEAEELLQSIYKKVDKMAKRNMIHDNKANRKKSQFAKKLEKARE